ncbi:WG repeat-containing protein, partial [Campylobacter coli]|nr:WG repeat-containing protein [Campylobacter coli]
NFSEGLAAVGLNGKWGFIDKNGEFAIKPKFDDIWDFREGLASVGLNGKIGLIDKSGKFVIEPKFDDIRY